MTTASQSKRTVWLTNHVLRSLIGSRTLWRCNRSAPRLSTVDLLSLSPPPPPQRIAVKFSRHGLAIPVKKLPRT